MVEPSDVHLGVPDVSLRSRSGSAWSGFSECSAENGDDDSSRAGRRGRHQASVPTLELAIISDDDDEPAAGSDDRSDDAWDGGDPVGMAIDIYSHSELVSAQAATSSGDSDWARADRPAEANGSGGGRAGAAKGRRRRRAATLDDGNRSNSDGSQGNRSELRAPTSVADRRRSFSDIESVVSRHLAAVRNNSDLLLEPSVSISTSSSSSSSTSSTNHARRHNSARNIRVTPDPATMAKAAARRRGPIRSLERSNTLPTLPIGNRTLM